MKLRGYPLLSHNGTPSWPPTWWWKGAGENKNPTGEVGILKQVLPCSIKAADRCYLVMEHEGTEYFGILAFQDYAYVSKSTVCCVAFVGGPFRRLARSITCFDYAEHSQEDFDR
jgi:hypothetical protein